MNEPRELTKPKKTVARLERKDWLLALLVSTVALLIYCLTLAPTVTGEDAGELIAAAYLTGVPHPPGYPLWCLLTKPFLLLPFGDIAWKVNFASAFFGALTTGGLLLLLRRWRIGIPAAFAASLALAFSREFWSQSTIAEVYTLNAFLLITVMHLLVSIMSDAEINSDSDSKCQSNWHISLLALGLVFGLSLGNHYMLMLLVSPGLALMLIPARTFLLKHWKHFLAATGLGLCGVLVYLYLPYAASENTFMNWGNPDSLPRLLAHVSRTAYRDLEFATPITGGTRLLFFAHFLQELWQQFTPWLCLLLPVGLFALYRQNKTAFFSTATVFIFNTFILLLIVNFTFEAENRQRVEPYYLPAYMMAALWLGFALDAVYSGFRLQASVVRLGHSENFRDKLVSQDDKALIPCRDSKVANSGGSDRKSGSKALSYACSILLLALPVLPCVSNWQTDDRSHFTIAREYAESILRTAEPNAILFTSADFTTFPIIYLMGVEGQRPDILLADKTGCPADEKATWNLYCRLPLEKRLPREKLKAHQLVYDFVMHQSRPVYITDRSVAPPHPDLHIFPCGLLYRVVRNGTAESLPPDLWKDIVIRKPELAAQSSDAMERALAAAYYRMSAEGSFRFGDQKAAVEFLRKAAAAISDDHKGLNNLGSVAAEHGLDELAENFFRQALRVWPEYVTPYANLANLALKYDRKDEAKDLIAAAERIDPKHFMVGKAREKLAQVSGTRANEPEKMETIPLTERIAFLHKQLKENPKEASLWNDLGTAWAQSGKLSQAADCWKKAVALKADYALPHRNLAIYYEKEEKNEALAKLHRDRYLLLSGELPEENGKEIDPEKDLAAQPDPLELLPENLRPTVLNHNATPGNNGAPGTQPGIAHTPHSSQPNDHAGLDNPAPLLPEIPRAPLPPGAPLPGGGSPSSLP